MSYLLFTGSKRASQEEAGRQLGMEIINKYMLKYSKHIKIKPGTYEPTAHCKHTGCLSTREGSA